MLELALSPVSWKMNVMCVCAALSTFPILPKLGPGLGIDHRRKGALSTGTEKEKPLESFPTFTFFILSSLGPCYLGNFGINGSFLS